MLNALLGKSNIIAIIGTEYAALFGSESQLAMVIIAKRVEITHGNRINAQLI